MGIIIHCINNTVLYFVGIATAMFDTEFGLYVPFWSYNNAIDYHSDLIFECKIILSCLKREPILRISLVKK